MKKHGQMIPVVSRFLTPQIFTIRFFSSPLAHPGVFKLHSDTKSSSPQHTTVHTGTYLYTVHHPLHIHNLTHSYKHTPACTHSYIHAHPITPLQSQTPRYILTPYILISYIQTHSHIHDNLIMHPLTDMCVSTLTPAPTHIPSLQGLHPLSTYSFL